MLLSVFHLTGLPGWSCPNFSHQRSSGAESRTGSTHFPTKTAGIAPQNLLFPKFESQLSVAIWGGNAKNSLIQNLPSKKLQLLWTLVLKIVTLSQMQWWKWGKTGFKQSSYDFRRDLLQGLGGKLTFTVEKSDVSEKWDANQPQRETDIVKERRKMTTDKMKSSMGSNQKETENNYKRRKMAEETPKRKRNCAKRSATMTQTKQPQRDTNCLQRTTTERSVTSSNTEEIWTGGKEEITALKIHTRKTKHKNMVC